MPQTITFPVAMGDEVKDRVTGYVGIVVAMYAYFNRCQRILVQPPVGADGKIPDGQVFDVEQCDVITSAKIAQKPDRGEGRNPNGPMPTPSRPFAPTR